MPELRKDPVIGRWVIISTERARRPGVFVDPYRSVVDLQNIQFKLGQDKTIYESKNGRVRVVPSQKPVLQVGGAFYRRGYGIYDVVSGYGAHEIVIETPDATTNMADLDVEQIRLVIETYVARIKDLENDRNLEYVFIYKNYLGRKLASGFPSFSQVLGCPVVPLHIREKLTGAKRYYDFHDRCVYTDLFKQETENGQRLVTQSEHFVAVAPFASRSPFEMLVIPKKQHCDFYRGVVGVEADLAKVLKDVLTRIKIGLDDPAYNLVINSSPYRRKGVTGPLWKSIEDDYCWHIEIKPRLTHVAGFEKGTEFYICSIPPEATAEYLREIEL